MLKMQSLNIEAARRHGQDLVAGVNQQTGGTPISLNTPDIVNILVSATNNNPFFDSPLFCPTDPLSTSLPFGSGDAEHEQKTYASLDKPSISVPKTVQSIRSHLIKETLKDKLQMKRKLSGKGEYDPREELAVKVKKREELTPEDEERRKRRRERNKVAATKCRNKKKEKTVLLIQESESLEGNNVTLKSEISKLESERQRLLEVLAAHAPNCKQIQTSNTFSNNTNDFNRNQSYNNYDTLMQSHHQHHHPHHHPTIQL